MSNVIDTRWELLRSRPWKCACCGELHEGLPQLGALAPIHWEDSSDPLPNSAVSGSNHGLSEDFCIIQGEHYFIRCVLPLPLLGDASGEVFTFGVWSSLAERNFRSYVETFDNGEQEGAGPWFGWFSNRLAGYPDTQNLKCHVHPQGGRDRPLIELEPSSTHPLAVESRTGITYERLLAILDAHGHLPVLDAPSG